MEKNKKAEENTNKLAEKLDNAKLDKIISLLEAIDWKIWVYLKANKYIDIDDNKK